jgi:hypoxia up-regulated 1
VKVLATLAAADEARHARESAKNSVEAYIYATREKLDSTADGVAAASTEEQVEALREALMSAEEWLYDDGAAADTATYKR